MKDRIEVAKKELEKYIEGRDIGIYFIDIGTDTKFGINEDKIFYAASIAKLPALLYTQKLLNESKIHESKAYKYYDYINYVQGAMIRGGTGVLQHKVLEGESIDIKTLVSNSASNSDNLASNMLSYYVCDRNDGEFKKYISYIIGRYINDFKKEFSAKEAAILMKHIYLEGGLTLKSLEDTAWDQVKIPKYLPVKCAHKVGFNGEYNHDTAIIYDENPYVLAIMTKSESDELISEVAYKCYYEIKGYRQ